MRKFLFYYVCNKKKIYGKYRIASNRIGELKPGEVDKICPYVDEFYTLCLLYICYLTIFVFLCGKIQTRESYYRTRKYIYKSCSI